MLIYGMVELCKTVILHCKYEIFQFTAAESCQFSSAEAARAELKSLCCGNFILSAGRVVL